MGNSWNVLVRHSRADAAVDRGQGSVGTASCAGCFLSPDAIPTPFLTVRTRPWILQREMIVIAQNTLNTRWWWRHF
jgi:hypothetical protein